MTSKDTIQRKIDAATKGAFIDSLDSLRCVVQTHDTVRKKQVLAHFYGGEKVAEANAELFVCASASLERMIAIEHLLSRLIAATEDQDAAPDDVANQCWLIAQEAKAFVAAPPVAERTSDD